MADRSEQRRCPRYGLFTARERVGDLIAISFAREGFTRPWNGCLAAVRGQIGGGRAACGFAGLQLQTGDAA